MEPVRNRGFRVVVARAGDDELEALSGQLMASALERRPILVAVCRRDAESAQALVRAHLNHTRELRPGRLPAGLAVGALISR